MSKVIIKDKAFRTFIPEADILERVKAVVKQINTDLAGKEPLFLAVLNGSFVSTADLMRYITIPSEISFVRLVSYQGIASVGIIKEVIGPNKDITNRHMVIVEDIVDTGVTTYRIAETLGTYGPASVDIYTLLLKSGKPNVSLDIKYMATRIPNDFIVGCGFNYEQQRRNLRGIYTSVEE